MTRLEEQKSRPPRFFFDSPPEGDHTGCHSVSPSQVERFDVDLNPGTACERKWALESLHRMRPPENVATSRGHGLHAEVRGYYELGTPVTSPALIAGMRLWPEPGPDIQVERWMTIDVPGWPDDRPQRRKPDGYPIGYGRFVGRSDIIDPRDPRVVRVIDIKSTMDFKWSKKAHQLYRDPQMVSYGRELLDEFPDAERVVYQHIVHRVDPKKRFEARPVTLEVSRAENAECWGGILVTIGRMREAAATRRDWREFPQNRRACDSYGGCEFAAFCLRSSGKPDLAWAAAAAIDFLSEDTKREDDKMIELTISSADAQALGDKVKAGAVMNIGDMAKVWIAICGWAASKGPLLGLDAAQTTTLLGRGTKALKHSLDKIDEARKAGSAHDVAMALLVRAAAKALDLHLGKDETMSVPAELMEAAKLPQLAEIAGWLKSLEPGSAKGASSASPDGPREDGEAAKRAEEARRIIEQEQAKAKAAASPAESPKVDIRGPRICILDKLGAVKGAGVLGDEIGVVEIRGSEFLAPFLAESAKQLGVSHHGLADYAHGKHVGVSLALDALRRLQSGYIIYLDTRDPVQHQLATEGMSLFTVVI